MIWIAAAVIANDCGFTVAKSPAQPANRFELAHSLDVLAKVHDDNPAVYRRIVTSLVPRNLIPKQEYSVDYSGLSMSELEEIFQRE